MGLPSRQRTNDRSFPVRQVPLQERMLPDPERYVHRADRQTCARQVL